MKTLTLAALALSVLTLACAHTRPDEMSTEAHALEEAKHRREAADNASRYDPDARVATVAADPWSGDRALIAYNPTERHLEAAEAHRKHAEAHAHAMQTLIADEAAACGTLAQEARKACPLISPWVTRVVETGKGVELQLKPGAPAEQLTSLMRCHFQHARAEGFPEEERESCPLFLKGSEITLEADTIFIQSMNPKTAALIRKDARRIFGAPEVTAERAP